MTAPSQSGKPSRFVFWVLTFIVLMVVAIVALVWRFALNDKSDETTQTAASSINFDSLAKAAKGSGAERCVAEKQFEELKKFYFRFGSGRFEQEMYERDVYGEMFGCITHVAKVQLEVPNKHINAAAPVPYGEQSYRIRQFSDAEALWPNSSRGVVNALYRLKEVNAKLAAGAENKAVAARKAQWKAWSDKWGNPPADPVVAKHVKQLKVQMDREGVDGEQKLIKGIYCSSTNDRKVKAAVIVLVNELIADGAKPGLAANTVLEKLDALDCTPASGGKSSPKEPTSKNWYVTSDGRYHSVPNDGPR